MGPVYHFESDRRERSDISFNPESSVGREDRDGKGGRFYEQKSVGRSGDYGQTFL